MGKMTLNQNSKINMLDGPLVPNIIKYALPLAFTGILQQVFNAADIAVVGQFAGKEAMAAVGSNSPVIGLLVNLFVGISLGANVVIAHASGQKNDARIEKTVHTSILVSLIGGVLIAGIGEALAKPIVSVMGVPDDVSEMALLYLRIYVMGLPVIFLYNFESAIFRSRGNTRLPLVALLISGVVNVILNLFFVLVLKMTVDGVALATVISNLISSAMLFVFLLKSDDKIKVSFSKLKIDLEVLGKMLKIGVPSGLQGMVFSLSNIVVQSAINSLGATVMAASAAAFNLEIFSFYMMNSFGQACTTFVGQNFGARQNERCKKILRTCLILCLVFT
ncbi:MAG: MATE family efflux transporter, partial [Treponema sp.]|nr:MATE family efflux transporter [Treponema sp.]